MLVFYYVFVVSQIHKPCLILDIIFLKCQFVFSTNYLSNDEYSNLLIIEAFTKKYFSSKTSSPVKHSYLLAFPDDKSETVAVCLSKSY